jgi:hypothetical protein
MLSTQDPQLHSAYMEATLNASKSL